MRVNGLRGDPAKQVLLDSPLRNGIPRGGSGVTPRLILGHAFRHEQSKAALAIWNEVCLRSVPIREFTLRDYSGIHDSSHGCS